jgi:hypothetical protein
VARKTNAAKRYRVQHISRSTSTEHCSADCSHPHKEQVELYTNISPFPVGSYCQRCGYMFVMNKEISI